MKKIITPRKNTFPSIREIWEYRELFFFLSLRDIKLRYKQSFFAIFWAVIPSLFLAYILSISFGNVFTNSIHIPYFLFAFCGIIFWNYFFTAVNRISNSLIANKSLITKIYFPKILVPLSSILVSLFDFLWTTVIFFILLFIFHISFSLHTVVIFLISLFITTIFALSLGIFFSVLQIFYKDTREILPLFTTFLFFLTPVIYPTKTILKPYNEWLYLNPLTGSIDALRISLTTNIFLTQQLLFALFISFVLFFIACFYFLMKESEITDIL